MNARNLTPYDRGTRLEPQLRPLGDDPDSYGRVDFDNDESATVLTAYVEREGDGYAMHVAGMAEPLSLAEELAEEAELGFEETDRRYEQIKQGDIHIAELQRMGMGQLIEQAKAENIEDYVGLMVESVRRRLDRRTVDSQSDAGPAA